MIISVKNSGYSEAWTHPVLWVQCSAHGTYIGWYCFISILAWIQFWISFKVDPSYNDKKFSNYSWNNTEKTFSYKMLLSNFIIINMIFVYRIQDHYHCFSKEIKDYNNTTNPKTTCKPINVTNHLLNSMNSSSKKHYNLKIMA